MKRSADLQSGALASAALKRAGSETGHNEICRVFVMPQFWQGRKGWARRANFQVCGVAGFPTRVRRAFGRLADWEIGDTAGWETCATPVKTEALRVFPLST